MRNDSHWDWITVLFVAAGTRAPFSFSSYLNQTDWGHVAIILFVNKWVRPTPLPSPFLSEMFAQMRHEWHSPCCVLQFYFIFSPSLEVLTAQQKDPLLCLVVTSVCLFLTCNMIHISIHIKPGKLPLSEPTGLRAEISSLGNERSASGGQEKERRALQSCGMEWAAMQVTCMCYWETQSPWPGMQFFFVSMCGDAMPCLWYSCYTSPPIRATGATSSNCFCCTYILRDWHGLHTRWRSIKERKAGYSGTKVQTIKCNGWTEVGKLYGNECMKSQSRRLKETAGGP